MSVTLYPIDQSGVPDESSPVIIKCGSEHSLFIEQPPELAVRRFFSWNQSGTIELFGGRMSRPIFIECWIHDSAFTDVKDIDDYIKTLDLMGGDYVRVNLVAAGETMVRDDCRFVGFVRKPFDGQRLPQPIPAIGTHGSSYGDWHICGELHFVQLVVE